MIEDQLISVGATPDERRDVMAVIPEDAYHMLVAIPPNIAFDDPSVAEVGATWVPIDAADPRSFGIEVMVNRRLANGTLLVAGRIVEPPRTPEQQAAVDESRRERLDALAKGPPRFSPLARPWAE